jgi:hypothetical protein
MDESPRFFSVEEANEVVGTLEIEFGRIARVREELGPVVSAVGGADAAVAILHENADLTADQQAEAERLRLLAAELTGAIERVNALGCLVKDVEQGLVDFYSMLDGEPVFLCWQFGEPGVTHWHPVDAGFAGRQPIEGVMVVPPVFPN